MILDDIRIHFHELYFLAWERDVTEMLRDKQMLL